MDLIGNDFDNRTMDTNDPKKLFGVRVRALRHELGISQEELAERSELDRTYISGVERGVRNVSLVNIFKIAEALGVSPKTLFDFKQH